MAFFTLSRFEISELKKKGRILLFAVHYWDIVSMLFGQL